MRLVEKHPTGNLPKIVRSTERDARLAGQLSMEIEDALTALRPLARVWVEAKRQYAGIPKRPMRDVPVPNAPNIEVPLGALLADDVYAQATDTLFTASPLITVRPVDTLWVDHAKAAQDWVNWLCTNELNLRPAVNNAFLDNTQLGTGIFYIPFVEHTKKDRLYKTTYRSPRVFAVSPEDFIVPPGSRGDIQLDRWVAVRFYYTKGELEERATKHGWDITDAAPTIQYDIVRMQHERKANMRGNTPMWREVYEICEVYCYFDYDEDGMDEDLLVTFDRTSRKVLNVTFNPYDTRPIEVMRYQLRAHLPYGIGIMEMVQPMQEEVTELHCYTMLNIFLANARVWAIAESSYPHDTIEIKPGDVKKFQTDDIRKAIGELKMSEVYPSAFQAQMASIQLAERRVGTSGAAGLLAKGGSRTPGVTALSLLQQVNRRFAPAFDGMREATGAAVRQAIVRYAERVKAGDKETIDHITMVMGAERATLIVELLRTDNFANSVAVEFTASSAQVNREADRQNSIMVANLLGQYYGQTASLAMQAANQQMPPEVRAVLLDVAAKGTEMMERTLRTFDSVRDPKTFLLNLESMEAGMEAANQQDALNQQAGIMQMLAQLAVGGGQQDVPELGAEPISAPGVASSGAGLS